MNAHRDKYLDTLEGKRVKVWFKDGDILTGNLIYVEADKRYALKNCMDFKRGIIRHCSQLEFRKSHIKRVEVAHG